MKKLLIGVAACFTLCSAALALGATAEASYIVGLSDTWQDSVHRFSKGELTKICAAEGVYLADSADTVAELRRSGALEYAEPDCTVRLLGEANDALYAEQWNLQDTKLTSLWDMELNAEGIRIAVIDSGLYAAHDDFAGVHILSGINFLNGSDDWSDKAGHGTFVTGIIAAARNNDIGIAGIVNGADIVPLKCFDESDETNVSYIVNAIYKAVDDYHCDVINLSLGLSKDMQSFRQAVDYAAERGVIIVSSVGNFGGEALMYPAAYDNVVGVGAVNQDGKICSFSQYNESVFVAAPGAELCSLGITASNAYMVGNGTSFATPHVTALAAAAKGYDASIDVYRFQELLSESAIDRGAPGYDKLYGYGTLDAEAFARLLTAPALSNGTYFQASAQVGETLEYKLTDLFSGRPDTPLTYHVAADNADGMISIDGDMLCYTPVAADAYKQVRLALSASDGAAVSRDSAYLTISVSGTLSAPEPAFSDLSGHWAHAYIAQAVQDGLFSGVSGTEFAPDDGMTRAMLVTVIARIAGADTANRPAAFTDVPEGKWYAGSVAWATENNIVGGVGNGLFLPETNVTRQELVSILYRYAKTLDRRMLKAPDALMESYTDLDSVAPWAAEPMDWAIACGLISGDTDSTLSPARAVTRAEAVVLLLRFLQTF